MNNRILVVDDHPAVRLAVNVWLASEGFEVVADTGDGADALALAEALCPLTMVLDIGIPTLDGLAVISKIVAKRLPVKIIVLTGQSSEHLQAQCSQLGAHGFVSKRSEAGELVQAIRAVQANEQYFPGLSRLPGDTDADISEHALLSQLSAREYGVMQQLLQGKAGTEIAAYMQISIKTVSTYKRRLFFKLKVGSLVALSAMVKRNTLL